MGPLALIIAFELALTGSIIGFSSHPKLLYQTKHKLSNVLGVQKIAQVDDSSVSPPIDSTQPIDQISTTPEPDASSPSPDQTAPSDQNLFDTEINPSPSNQEGSSANPNSSQESPANPEENFTQTAAVLNPSDLINSPDNINSQSVDEAKKEEDQIAQTTDPIKQTELLINFAIDKVKDMNNFSKLDDFTSTNFAAQRFNDQMDQAIGNLDKFSPKDRTRLKKRLVNFCNQADLVLRTVELSVPEESEQDLQIARGQCQELSL